MEVDRRVWRKVRRRIGDPTKEGLSRGGGSSSPPLSGQPTGHMVEEREEYKFVTAVERGFVRGGSGVKVNGGRGLGYKSSAGLMEGWLGKSKVKVEVYAKDKGGPGTCLRSKEVRGGRKQIGKITGKKTACPVFGSKKLKGKSGEVNCLSLIEWLHLIRPE